MSHSSVPKPEPVREYATDVKVELIHRGIRQRELAKLFQVSDAAISKAIAGCNVTLLEKIRQHLQSTNQQAA